MVRNSTACSGTGKAPEHRYKRFLIFTILAPALLSLLQAQNIIKNRGRNEGRHDRRNKLSDLGCFPRHVPMHAIPGFRYGAICSLAPSLQPVRAIVAQNDAAAHSHALPSREDTAQLLPGTCLISPYTGKVVGNWSSRFVLHVTSMVCISEVGDNSNVPENSGGQGQKYSHVGF